MIDKRTERVLYITVACAGAVFLGVEMAGSRVLAPSFGNSIYVWGSLIAQFMAAYALGSRLGGALADRKPSAEWLMGLLIAAGLITSTVIPFVGMALCRQVASLAPSDAFGPLIASLILFFVPSVLMAMAPPYAIKLLATSLKNLGSVAGKVSSMNTVGSIVGALFTAFVLVRFISVSTIFHVIGLLLILVGIVCWALRPRVQAA